MPSEFIDPLDNLLLWGKLAAAHVRNDAFCINQHRHTLIERGESLNRVDEIPFSRKVDIYSAVEKAVISFSEAISRDYSADEMEVSLSQTQQFLKANEIQRLSASVLAVNDWIDTRGSGAIRVLVVEDNLDDQELLNLQLKKTSLGNHVLFLSDPRAALGLIQGPYSEEFRKNLIVIMLDLHLPHLTGIEALRIIRSLPTWKDFPVIIMTTDNHPENIAACKELKVTAFVEKPVTLSSFASMVAPFFHQPVKNGGLDSVGTCS